MKSVYYVLNRDEEWMVVGCTKNDNPLHGKGSWDIYAGPFKSYREAENNAPGDDEPFNISDILMDKMP